ncbi:acyl carrier protein phosphodiesterase [Dyadobacter tibetensis]|uniref:acyl carrier protein phosphodiesterase n=1 Tax=Dyadobacter tibetensis TaxID=1211851 RepID=UPI00047162BB|nr:ACP phosphodiesterase [Dyadobacter tibetensis]
MNYLAHILLSGNSENVIMGNFVGDFVKGRLLHEKYPDWSKEYLLGLRLHRFIDYYTDTHAVVREAKKRIALRYGRISGIIVDIYFDYFLASDFLNFCPIPLTEYSQNMYALFERRKEMVPNSMQGMVSHMVRQNWLLSYATLEGIDLTFSRMSRRAEFLLPIQNAGMELRNNEDIYRRYFKEFYPELTLASNIFLQNSLQ